MSAKPDATAEPSEKATPLHRAMHYLVQCHALARIKWGNLDPDADRVLTEAADFMNAMESAPSSPASPPAVDGGAEAIVAKLPKTADGVPIVPGMMVYAEGTAYPFTIHAIDDDEMDYTWSLAKAMQRSPRLYSTCEAALARLSPPAVDGGAETKACSLSWAEYYALGDALSMLEGLHPLKARGMMPAANQRYEVEASFAKLLGIKRMLHGVVDRVVATLSPPAAGRKKP